MSCETKSVIASVAKQSLNREEIASSQPTLLAMTMSCHFATLWQFPLYIQRGI